MDILIVSNIVLWIGFAVLVLTNLALARQVGVLYERVAPAGALMVNQKLSAGDKAPRLSLSDIEGNIQTLGETADGKSQLLFFLSPDCPVCNQLTPILKSAMKIESNWLQLVLASDGEEQDHAGYVARKGLGNFPYVVSELLGKTYGVSKLPYAVLIDEQNRIASMGIINSREHLESLFEAKEHKVTSIQEFMQKKNETAQSAETQRK